jgi:hypothetical protein
MISNRSILAQGKEAVAYSIVIYLGEELCSGLHLVTDVLSLE